VQASSKEVHILTTHIVGQALELVKNKSEEEIKDLLMDKLRSVFSRKVSEKKKGKPLLFSVVRK
jgi:hypothetical protein